jgi:hypothetical protein
VNVRYSPYFNPCYIKDLRQPPLVNGRVHGFPSGRCYFFFSGLANGPREVQNQISHDTRATCFVRAGPW